MRVEPIPSDSILDIKRILQDRPRDYALFVIGINSGLRPSDLVTLTVGHFWTGETYRPSVRLRMKKTGKWVVFAVNGSIREALDRWMKTHPQAKPSDFLFYSTNHGLRIRDRPLTTDHVYRLVRGWTSEIGLMGSFGGHSLRKTHGRELYNRGHEKLAQHALGHADSRVTERYLCITQDDVLTAQAGMNL